MAGAPLSGPSQDQQGRAASPCWQSRPRPTYSRSGGVVSAFASAALPAQGGIGDASTCPGGCRCLRGPSPQRALLPVTSMPPAMHRECCVADPATLRTLRGDPRGRRPATDLILSRVPNTRRFCPASGRCSKRLDRLPQESKPPPEAPRTIPASRPTHPALTPRAPPGCPSPGGG